MKKKNQGKKKLSTHEQRRRMMQSQTDRGITFGLDEEQYRKIIAKKKHRQRMREESANIDWE